MSSQTSQNQICRTMMVNQQPIDHRKQQIQQIPHNNQITRQQIFINNNESINFTQKNTIKINNKSIQSNQSIFIKLPNNSFNKQILRNIEYRKQKQKSPIKNILKIPNNINRNLLNPSSLQSPKKLRKLQSIQLNSTKQTISINRPPILLNNHCIYIDRSQILFKDGQQHNFQKYSQITAFWTTKCCYVRLIRVQGTQEYLQQTQHVQLVKIYGRIKIKFFQFIVTEALQGFTLQSIIQQYGPCSQKFVKRCIKNLIKGLSIIHNKGHVFNILTPSKIIIDSSGQAKIDITKAKSTSKLTVYQKRSNFYYISPQLLLNNQNGFINDTWSIGVITLTMILGVKINESIWIHPYNKLQKYTNTNKLFSQKILRFKKQYLLQWNSQSKYINNGRNIFKQQQKLYSLNQYKNKNIKGKHKQQILIQISNQLDNFMMDCLKIQGRLQINQLLNHQFLCD